MIKRALVSIAGVDHKILATCPATDRMWAVHLGLSLCISFVVVSGIVFYSTEHLVDDIWKRFVVALLVALTLFMFDRALFQSDWFFQRDIVGAEVERKTGNERWQSALRALRMSIRLLISVSIAWVIAVFLELTIFSDAITERMDLDRAELNRAIYEKVDRFETQLDTEIDRSRNGLASLEALLRNELGAPPSPAPAQLPRTSSAETDQASRLSDAQVDELRKELRTSEEAVRKYTADMNAEELGQRLNPDSSGRAGAGPRYEFAKRQKTLFEEQRNSIQAELKLLIAKQAEATAQQTRTVVEQQGVRDREASSRQARIASLTVQADAARASLKELETSRQARVNEFRRDALATSNYQKPKNDPLSRMMAYQGLKNDPKEGATVTLFSWMIKCFIIFLEIVPVVAKIFLSPPSVYAARIRAEVEREHLRPLQQSQTPVIQSRSDGSVTRCADFDQPSSDHFWRPHTVPPKDDRGDQAETPMLRPLHREHGSEPSEFENEQLPILSDQTVEFSPNLDKLIEERLANGKPR
jgi:hypothetical protein